jgi:hypothetical protein
MKLSRWWRVLPFLSLVLAFGALAARGDEGRGDRLHGRIAEVRPGTGQITVQTRDGKDHTLTVDDRSTLRVGGETAKLDQLKPGMRVRVRYAAGDGKDRVLALTAVPPAEDLRKQIRETLQAARAYGYQQKDEYARKLQGLLGDLDERIDELQEHAQEAKGQAHEEFDRQMKDLRRKREVVREQLDKVKAATPGA